MDFDKKAIGERIKEYRLKRGFTQSDLAKEANITRIALGNYERGERIPTIDIFARIAMALNVSMDELMGCYISRRLSGMPFKDNLKRLRENAGYKQALTNKNVIVKRIEKATELLEKLRVNNMDHFYKRPLPEPGEKWRHFKGHVYKIICIAEDTERINPVVVYQGVDDCAYWVRPLGMFMSEVDHEKYPDVTWKWRFQKVADADE